MVVRACSAIVFAIETNVGTCAMDTKYDDVYVFFDDKGVVTHVGASLDSEKASYSPFES